MSARFYLIVFAALIYVSGLSDANEPKSPEYKRLSSEQIMAVYGGQAINGVYNMPEGQTPMSYLEIHHDNATTSYEHYGDPSYKTKGVYIIGNDTICYSYNHEQITGTHCFYIFQSGNCYFHYSARRKVPVTKEHFETGWISYGFKKGTTATCEQGIS